jgi:hypothetical protein
VPIAGVQAALAADPTQTLGAKTPLVNAEVPPLRLQSGIRQAGQLRAIFGKSDVYGVIFPVTVSLWAVWNYRSILRIAAST